jgi:hypothetical protein
MAKDYFNYLNQLKEKELYKKDYLEFIASNLSSTGNRFFNLFYKNGMKVDVIMNKKGFARFTIDRIIRTSEITPVIQQFILSLNLTKIKAGLEPNWDSVYLIVSRKYNKEIADRCIRAEKASFYYYTKRNSEYIKNSIIQYLNNELDTTDRKTDILLNTLAFTIFMSTDDKDLLNTAIDITTGVIRRRNAFKDFPCLVMDTYANLLYKVNILYSTNKLEEAIAWEKKALDNAIEKQFNISSFRNTLDMMKKGQRTWPEKIAHAN